MLQQPKTQQYSVAWISKIGEIPQVSWDALAMPLKTPFMEWDWLNNLEARQVKPVGYRIT
jgi:predicted N-acyltransferase